MNNQTEPEGKELSMADIIKQARDFMRYCWEMKQKIVLIPIIGILLGLGAHFWYRPQYTATLSFAVQDNEGGSNISSLASQFGISLGGTSGDAFGGDNIYELFTSRQIIEKVLLTPVRVNNKEDLLINLYLKTYEIDEAIAGSKYAEVRAVRFTGGQNRANFSRSQDSIVNIVYTGIIKKQLSAQKRSKKLSIGDITFVAENELLAKLFVEGLIKETTRFYIETKTKQSRTNYDLLSRQTDSVKREYERALTARASMADNNLNLVRQSGSVGLAKKQTDIQVSMSTYIEMKKNLEMVKFSLMKQTPVIQIIDTPLLPLEKKKIGILKGTVLGGFLGGVMAILYLLFLYYNKDKK